MAPLQLLRALVPLLGLTCACAAMPRSPSSTGTGAAPDRAVVEAPPSRRVLAPRRGDLDNVGWA